MVLLVSRMMMKCVNDVFLGNNIGKASQIDHGMIVNI
jgi:hypothetical protein